MKLPGYLALPLALIACGSGGSSTGAGADAGTPDGASADGAALSDGPLPEAGAGRGTVSGAADGTPFTTVATSLWLGAPDDPATTVVYIFSNPVACAELQSMGWDARITTATQFLEMKMFGTSPANYAVTSSLTPAPGEASVNYTLSSRTATPMESGAATGTVTLTARTANTHVVGSFAVAFGGANDVSGTYDAVFCPGGHEP